MDGLLFILLMLGLLGLYLGVQYVLMKLFGLKQAGWKDFEQNGGQYLKISRYISYGVLLLLVIGLVLGIGPFLVLFVFISSQFFMKFLYEWKESDEPGRAVVTLILFLFVCSIIFATTYLLNFNM